MSTIKDLETKLRGNNSAEASATELVNGLADQLDGLTQDPVAIKALAQELRQSAATLGSAVVAGTPSTGGPSSGTPPNPVPHPNPSTQPGPGGTEPVPQGSPAPTLPSQPGHGPKKR